MSRLVVKFPTRNRPDKFRIVFNRYLTFLSGRHEVQFIITMDQDDATMNNPEIRQWLSTRARNADIRWYYGNSQSKVEACNANLDGVDGDVLILASDDMMPVKTGYDEIVFQTFAATFRDFDGAIRFWDGLRPPEDKLMTLTVMGFPLYRQFGYIYNPEYRSLCCDNEQTQVCAALNKLHRSDLCIIQHQWTGEPWDELHARNESVEMYDTDSETFRRRSSNHFDMETMFNVSVAR